jgi:hypothetical protein
MAPSDFASANVNEIIEYLTTDEAILLTAGVGFWHTHAVEILIYGLIHFTLFHQSVIVALHYDSIMSYYSS